MRVLNRNNISTVSCKSSKRKRLGTAGGRKQESSSDDVRPAKKVYRYECSADGCTKHAQQGGVCMNHGAKLKLCSYEGCTNRAQKGGVCCRHGAKVKRCSSKGCKNRSQKGGVCKRHGAKVKLCSSKGCENRSVKGGVCVRHGAK
eukprot:scaffold4387_cov94-Skeletonema_menzelii.AAC.1